MRGKTVLGAIVATSALATLVSTALAAQAARGRAPLAQEVFTASLPRFDRMVRLEETAATSANASVGDLNADGNLDIVLAKGRHWPLVDRVLFGDGKGGFSSGQDLGSASDRSYSGLLVDLDRDGDLDVVISNDRPDPKLVYLNDGKGRFQAGSSFGKPEWSTRNASVADLNSDGLPDIIVANRTGGNAGANYVCLNRGKGRFDADCTAFSTESATTITPADVNGDGLIDLVVPHRDGGQSQVYIREAGNELTFRRVPFGLPDATIRIAEAVDLDKDGHVDIITTDERRGIALYFGQGQDRFTAATPIGDAARTPYALAVGDLNLDGQPDIVVGHVEARSTVYFNDGSGRRFSPVPFGDSQGTVYGFSIGDLDKDGHPDIVVARSEAVNVVCFGDPPGRAAR